MTVKRREKGRLVGLNNNGWQLSNLYYWTSAWFWTHEVDWARIELTANYCLQRRNRLEPSPIMWLKIPFRFIAFLFRSHANNVYNCSADWVFIVHYIIRAACWIEKPAAVQKGLSECRAHNSEEATCTSKLPRFTGLSTRSFFSRFSQSVDM